MRARPIETDIVPLAPLIYVAWADADLSDVEIVAVHKAAARIPGLSDKALESLAHWLDPAAPPTASELASLRNRIRQVTAEMLPRERASLSAMCRDVALAAGAAEDTWASPEAQRALSIVDESLGLVGLTAFRGMLPGEQVSAAQSTPAFDVSALTDALDGTKGPIRRHVQAVLADPQFRYRSGLSTTAHRELVLAWTQALADAGIGGLAFPGVVGNNASVADFVAAFQTLATFDLSLLIKAGVQFGLFGGSIFFLGTEKHHQKYLPAVADLSLPGCFAMTEQGHGSDVRSIRTTATWDAERDGFVVHTPDDAARKEWIGNAASHGQLATVFAQLYVDNVHHDVHAFLVPIRTADGGPIDGVRIGDCGEKMGLNGVDNGRLWFDNVFIPRENLLDRYASVSPDGVYSSPIASPGKRFFTMLGTLVGGRVSVAGASVSVAKSALTIAIRYGARRRQFDDGEGAERALLDYPTHQARLMPALAHTYALHFAVAHLLGRYADTSAAGEPDREVEALAAALKAAASDHATFTVQQARESCGGQGYAAANRFAALKADSDVFTTFEGDNTVLRQLVARGLLGAFRAQFEHGVAGIARHILGRAAQAVSETNPVIARNTAESHLVDPAWHADLFQARQSDLVTSAAARLQKRIKDGLPPGDAVLQVQLHMTAAAEAWADQQVCAAFATAVADEASAEVQAALSELYELHALSRIRDHLGWFMENGYIAPSKARAIRRLQERRCADVRVNALALVDAFAIPDAQLGAPIGMREPNV